MKLLAIDPGIEKVGYSVFEKNFKKRPSYRYLTSGLIKTSRSNTLEIRLKKIYDDLKQLIDKHKPNLIVLEQLFYFKNAKTVISVAQAQGVIRLLAAQNNLSLKLLTPLAIKQIITGYGTADKKSVQKMLKLTLKEDVVIADDDQSDAIACGLAYCFLNESLVSG